MKPFVAGVASGVLILASVGFVLQRNAEQHLGAEQGRFIVYENAGQLPMLVDSRTGRTWIRQIAEGGKGDYPVVWTPVRFTPADTSTYWFEPAER